MAGLIASQHDETREVLRLSNKFQNNLLLFRTIGSNTITILNPERFLLWKRPVSLEAGGIGLVTPNSEIRHYALTQINRIFAETEIDFQIAKQSSQKESIL